MPKMTDRQAKVLRAERAEDRKFERLQDLKQEAKEERAEQRQADKPPTTTTETAGQPAPVVVPNGLGTSTVNPLAVPPRGFVGKPPSPGGIGIGCAR